MRADRLLSLLMFLQNRERATMDRLAEEHLGTIGPSTGRPGLVTGLLEGDSLREEILKRRGYEPRPEAQAYDRYRDLGDRGGIGGHIPQLSSGQ